MRRIAMVGAVVERATRRAWVQTDNTASGSARDKGKQRRFARIKAAARELFRERGYERTTLRQIATKARVSAATIVNYFGDKRDLLELLFNEEHRLVSDQAALELSEAKEFLDQSIDGFRHYYRYFGAYPEYARAILAGGTFHDPAVPDPSPGGQSMARSIARIKRTVEIARKRGEITLDESDDALALLIFEIYQNQCRHWLAAPKPDVEHGLAQLRHALGIIQRGFTPSRLARQDERYQRTN
jgi:AcrR family transcriptional regulator